MSEEKKRVEYGKDPFTFSINDETERKTEDWHNDWRGKIMIGDVLYYLNGYRKNDTWIAGKVVKASPDKQPAPETQSESKPLDDDIPFQL